MLNRNRSLSYPTISLYEDFNASSVLLCYFPKPMSAYVRCEPLAGMVGGKLS